jgi:tetratricopeptide (TPR) repeat protein
MEQTFTLRQRSSPLEMMRAADLGALSAWLLAVALTVYLGVRRGGFDTIVSSQVAIAAWWLVMLLLAFGLLRVRISRAGWICFGLLAGYAAWTTLSLAWTESAESTMTDVSQMLLYVALMLLVLLVQGRAAVRHMLNGLAVGIVVIAVIAVLSRLRFEWFAVPQVDIALSAATRRLSYPIEYWNALAALMAVGMPVLLYGATGARTLLARAAAAAALPLLALCAFLTASRGGVIEIGVGLVVFLALVPDRLPKIAIITVGGVGSALLIAAANQRAAVREGLRSALAAHQGDELIAIAIAVLLAVGLLVAAIVLVERHVARPRLLAISRPRTTQLSAAGLLALVVAFLGAGGTSFLQSKWSQFKTAGDSATSSQTAFARLGSSAGEGRYQYWQVEFHAANGKPLTGTGANTFQFLWLQRGNLNDGYVVDAHSLYMQALGDLGYPGLLLVVAFIGWIIGYGVWRVIRTRDPAWRLALAAATASAFAFAFAAAIDWLWFIPVLPLALFICAGVIVAPNRADEAGHPAGAPELAKAAPRVRRGRIALRAVIAVACLAAIVVIALPTAAAQELRASNSQATAGNLSAALADAHEAVSLQPYAAAGWLQEALVEEQGGDLNAALADAEQAKTRQAVNWQIWLVLSRLELRTGHAAQALADERHAHLLNQAFFPSA